jgi:hypothetical protein
MLMLQRFLLGLVFLSSAVQGAPNAYAQADQLTTITTIDVTFESLACNGDIVTVSGTVHTVSHFTIDPNGGVHFATAGTFRNSKGVGSDGTIYRVTGGNFSANNDSGGPQSEFNSITRLNLISAGRGANSTLFTVVHGTFNANGELTADFIHFKTGC